MRKRFGRTGLSNGSFDDSELSANPMSGVSNLADVMLVLAVGIMMAIMNRNAAVNAVSMDNLTEVESYDTLNENDLTVQDELGGLEEKGIVYVDPETGKIYLLVDED